MRIRPRGVNSKDFQIHGFARQAPAGVRAKPCVAGWRGHTHSWKRVAKLSAPIVTARTQNASMLGKRASSIDHVAARQLHPRDAHTDLP